MRARFWKLAICFLLAIPLCGCCNPDCCKSEPYRVISSVRVSYKNGPLEAQRVFLTSEKIQKIVDYLRRIASYGNPVENPETVTGSEFYIVVDYSDGSAQTYHQRADRLMRIGSGPWKRIDPKKAIDLGRILGAMTSDSPPSGTLPGPPLLYPYL